MEVHGRDRPAYSRARAVHALRTRHAHGARGAGHRSRRRRPSSCSRIATSPRSSSCAAIRTITGARAAPDRCRRCRRATSTCATRPTAARCEHALLVGQSGIQLARPDGSAGQQLDARDHRRRRSPPTARSRGCIGARQRPRRPAGRQPTRRRATVTAPTLDRRPASAGRGLTQMTVRERRACIARTSSGGDPRASSRARTLECVARRKPARSSRRYFSGGFRFEDGRAARDSARGGLQRHQGHARAARSRDGRAAAHQGRTRRPRRGHDRRHAVAASAGRDRQGVGACFAAGAPRRRARRPRCSATRKRCWSSPTSSSFDEATGERHLHRQRRVCCSRRAATQIRGETITMNEKTGTLTATGNVVTALPLAGRPRKAPRATSIGARRRVPVRRREAARGVHASRRSSTACRGTCAPIASS